MTRIKSLRSLGGVGEESSVRGILEQTAARNAAIELCLAVKDAGSVRIESVGGRDCTISWVGVGGGLVKKNFSAFLGDELGEGVRGLEGLVLSALKERAGISETQKVGSFSFIGPGEKSKPCTYNILMESFETEAGKALALTVKADKEEILMDEVLYRSE